MLKEPNFEYPKKDGKCYVCVEDGQYHAYLDRDAAIILFHDLYWLHDQSPGEEVSLSSVQWKELPQRGQSIGYCEFNLVPVHIQKKQGKNINKHAQASVRHKPQGIYSPEDDRLDYFVTSEEIKPALEALTFALDNSQGKRTRQDLTLFDTLVVHLVSS